jgi:hypothetical protein
MQRWRVHVGYWSGFTKSRAWQEEAQREFESLGLTDICFWNGYSEGFWTSHVDEDEVSFTMTGEKVDRPAVEQVLARVGISHTAYVHVQRTEPEAKAGEPRQP